jgi:N-methylhydantoinase A
VRYVGQSNEIEVPLPARPLTAQDASGLRAAFEEAYSRQFSRVIPGAPLEILNWSVKAEDAAGSAGNEPFKPSVSSTIDQVSQRRRIFEPRLARWADAEIVRRDDVPPGLDICICGPAVVVEKDTATFVTASFEAQVDPLGCIVLRPNRSANAT